MRRILLIVCLLASVPLLAATYGYEQLTIDSTAGGKGFTSAKITPAGAPPMTIAQCRLETGQIRYAYDGATVVSSTVGTLLEIGEIITLVKREDIVNFRAIRTTGTSGVLSCTYKDN